MRDGRSVSLWIGQAAAKTTFEEALAPEFSADGDFLGSAFSRAFGVGYYDEGLKESEYREAPRQGLGSLLEGISYAEVVVPRLQAAVSEPVEGNCFVLLHDYRHAGPRSWATEGLSMRYVATVEYDADAEETWETLESELCAISEAAFCADWMAEVEFRIWEIVSGGPRNYGQTSLEDEQLARLSALSERLGGWVWLNEKTDVIEYIPRPQWDAIYSEWAARRRSRR